MESSLQLLPQPPTREKSKYIRQDDAAPDARPHPTSGDICIPLMDEHHQYVTA